MISSELRVIYSLPFSEMKSAFFSCLVNGLSHLKSDVWGCGFLRWCQTTLTRSRHDPPDAVKQCPELTSPSSWVAFGVSKLMSSQGQQHWRMWSGDVFFSGHGDPGKDHVSWPQTWWGQCSSHRGEQGGIHQVRHNHTWLDILSGNRKCICSKFFSAVLPAVSWQSGGSLVESKVRPKLSWMASMRWSHFSGFSILMKRSSRWVVGNKDSDGPFSPPIWLI